jgi:hypothetical protein
MMPIEKFLQILGALIDVGNPETIGVAERAIEELPATGRDTDERRGLLNTLYGQLRSISENKNDPSLSFALILIECAAAHRRALREDRGCDE